MRTSLCLMLVMVVTLATGGCFDFLGGRVDDRDRNQPPEILLPQAASPNPSNGATDVSITPSVSWSPGTRAVSYDGSSKSAPPPASYNIYFGTVNPPTSAEFRSNTIYGTSYIPGALTFSSTYYWRIDSKNTAGTTTGVVWSFTTKAPTPPAQTVLYSPWNGMPNVSITTQLLWSSATDATSYDVYFSAEGGSASGGGISTSWTPVTNTVLTSYALSSLLYATTYYWRIDAKNSAGTTTGAIGSFTTEAIEPPAQVTSPNPPNGATGVPITQQLSWASASGATYYAVYFYTSWPGAMESGTTYNPGTLAYGTTYSWRIDSRNSVGSTAGIVWTFTTLSPPASVTSPTPANDATSVPITQQLSWASASGATSYDVYFSAEGGSASGGGISTSWTPVTNTVLTSYALSSLLYATTYYWRIDSINPAGPTTGTVWSFNTIAPPPQVASPTPADEATNIIITQQLSWGATSGATSYDVYFGTSAAPPFVANLPTTSYIPATLSYSTTYYWRIDAKNSDGATAGIVWSFTTEPVPFLLIQGDQFVLNGSTFRMKGFNYFPRNYGWASMTEWDWNEVDEELALGASLGANTVRTFIDYGFSTDNPDESKSIYTFYHPTTAYISAMNQFLAIADKYGLKVIFSLFSFSPGWSFIDNSEYWLAEQYLDELIPYFRDDRRIAAWDIMNEGDILVDKFGTDFNKILGFYAAMSAHLNSLDENHLLTAGFGKIQMAHYSQDFVDYISFHDYYDPALLGVKIRSLKSNLTRTMPIVYEEFGFPSAGNQWASLSGQMVQLGGDLDIALNTEALAGTLFWILIDFNPPNTTLYRNAGDDLNILKHGVFSSTLEAKASVDLIRNYWAATYTATNRIKIQYSNVLTETLPNDGRYLAIGMQYIEFLDAISSVISTITFGTTQTNQFQGQGWYANESWGQWSGNLDKVNVLYYDVPPNAVWFRFRAHSYHPSNDVGIWLADKFLGSVTISPAPADYVLAIPP